MRQDGEKFLSEDILKVKAAVIGDVMMDQYVTGSVNRISPEAPVPVNLVKGERNVPGGAANTAANLASLGCQVFVSGIVGNDQNGKMLLDLLKNAGIDSNGILVSDDYQTTAKIRILGAGQQMMRLDYERTRKLTDDECESVMEWLCGLLKAGLDCVVISDYGKGMIDDILSQKIIKKANEYNVPVLVDPKGSDWEKYDGAYGITPNLKELSDCAGKSIPNESAPIEAEGKRIREKFHLKYLFVTRSERGITCIMDGGAIHRASVAQDVFDVSGAGDTVMAVTAACAAAGIDMETTLELANRAAGIAVSHVGTYQVERKEVLDAWRDNEPVRLDYLPLTWKEAENKINLWKARGETVVFTNGCFDILHRGHVTYLQKAASLGDHLIVGLNSDDSVKMLKGEDRPVNRENDRSFMLAALRCVDDVVVFGEETPEKLLTHLKPDILVKGGDYKAEEVAGRQYAGSVEILPFVDGYSTTGVIKKIKREKQ